VGCEKSRLKPVTQVIDLQAPSCWTDGEYSRQNLLKIQPVKSCPILESRLKRPLAEYLAQFRLPLIISEVPKQEFGGLPYMKSHEVKDGPPCPLESQTNPARPA
jgi:hypothetical protein